MLLIDCALHEIAACAVPYLLRLSISKFDSYSTHGICFPILLLLFWIAPPYDGLYTFGFDQLLLRINSLLFTVNSTGRRSKKKATDHPILSRSSRLYQMQFCDKANNFRLHTLEEKVQYLGQTLKVTCVKR